MTAAITAPGVYGIDEAAYHADPVVGGSLSSTGARKLVLPAGPARFDYDRRHGTPPKRTFEFGHAAHRLALGEGADIVLVEAANYRTDAAQQAQREAREAGKTPLLPHEYAVVVAMADAIREHPVAGRLFAPGRGVAERSLIWQDPRTGVWCRARPDWMTDGADRLIIADYKTAVSLEDDALERAIWGFGYHQQDDWYLSGAGAVYPGRNTAFVFVGQEKTAPYLVRVFQVDPFSRQIAAYENRNALNIYRRCTESGVWPGYSSEVELVGLPGWVQNRYDIKEIS